MRFLSNVVFIVLLKDILDFDDSEQHCRISKCETEGCKTWAILINDADFTSILTKKSYFTRSYDYLNCKSINGVYGLECNLCGLVYVGETIGRLNKHKEYFIIFGVCMVFIFVICLIIPEKDEEKKQPVDRETDSNQSSLTDEIEIPVDCEEPSSHQLLSDPNEPPTTYKEPRRQQLLSDQNEPPAEYEESSRQQLLNVEVHQPTDLEAETKQNNF